MTTPHNGLDQYDLRLIIEANVKSVSDGLPTDVQDPADTKDKAHWIIATPGLKSEIANASIDAAVRRGLEQLKSDPDLLESVRADRISKYLESVSLEQNTSVLYTVLTPGNPVKRSRFTKSGTLGYHSVEATRLGDYLAPLTYKDDDSKIFMTTTIRLHAFRIQGHEKCR